MEAVLLSSRPLPAAEAVSGGAGRDVPVSPGSSPGRWREAARTSASTGGSRGSSHTLISGRAKSVRFRLSRAALARALTRVSEARPAIQMPLACFFMAFPRSEEHTSELQSRGHLVCRLLLEKK